MDEELIDVLVDSRFEPWPELATRGLPLIADDLQPLVMSAADAEALAAWDSTDGPLAVAYLKKKKDSNGGSKRHPGRETTDVVDKKQTVIDGRRPRREWDEYHKAD